MANEMTSNSPPTGESSHGRPLSKVVALLVGEPRAPELWTLKKLAAASALHVVRAQDGTSVSAAERLQTLRRKHGVSGLASRLIAKKLVVERQERRQLQRLDQLLDGEHLREWWQSSGITPVHVPHLNHADARSAIESLQPDIMVRVSGGILKRETFSLAQHSTLNIHHGQAPHIRGMWSIPWGIVEGRPEWIGATVHVIDDGIDTGRVLWRGTPQLAPGDTGDELFFRAHLEAVDALVRVILDYPQGTAPTALQTGAQGPSVYRSAPGLRPSLRYLRLGRGRRAPFILERAVKC